MSSTGTLNDWLTEKVRQALIAAQQNARSTETIEPHHFKNPEEFPDDDLGYSFLAYGSTADQIGAIISECSVSEDIAGSALKFEGNIEFIGSISAAFEVLGIQSQLYFEVFPTQYEVSSLLFNGIHLRYSPIAIHLSMRADVLDTHYRDNGLLEAILMETLRQ